MSANPNIVANRHLELFDPNTFNQPINIIGAGATGSWLALFLAKLGINGDLIKVYDFDTIEAHNVANQLYGYGDIGRPKVEALEEYITNETGTKIRAINEKYENQPLAGYVFLMVDSMAERKRIWEQSIKYKPSVKLLVEPRMGINLGRIYNVVPIMNNHVKEYEQTFYDDSEAEVSACGASMTVITTAVTISSFCARQLINFHAGEEGYEYEEVDNEIIIDLKYNGIHTNSWE